MDQISVLRKGPQGALSLVPPPEPGSGLSPDPESAAALLLDFPASRNVRNTCLLLLSHPVYAVLL